MTILKIKTAGTKITVRVVCVPAKIQTEYHPIMLRILPLYCQFSAINVFSLYSINYIMQQDAPHKDKIP
jgi:hypothetical protein